MGSRNQLNVSFLYPTVVHWKQKHTNISQSPMSTNISHSHLSHLSQTLPLSSWILCQEACQLNAGQFCSMFLQFQHKPPNIWGSYQSYGWDRRCSCRLNMSVYTDKLIVPRYRVEIHDAGLLQKNWFRRYQEPCSCSRSSWEQQNQSRSA